MSDTGVTDNCLPQRFRDWFVAREWHPRAHQLELTQAALSGESALLIAPTGGGKTLAGFLASLVELSAAPRARPALHTLYISPLKALAVDVRRNLTQPADEMALGLRIESRTGDTPAAARQRQRKSPPDILLTTPEQLALFIASGNAASFFADLRAVIIDEIHAIAPTRRGDLLSLGLASLAEWAPECRFIGLSATVRDPGALARWLDLRIDAAPPRIIRAAGGAKADLSILVSRERIPWAGHSGRFAVAEVYEAIKQARTALVFVNTRSQAELLFQELWRANDDHLPIALHHGSLSREQRQKVEAAMSGDGLRAVVCTSTLDLGIDWGGVDLVIQMGAPKGSARLIQRIGRANHRMDEASRALLVPTNRFEVLECRAAEAAVNAGELDGETRARGSLDVLAQHVMGRACGDGFHLDALFEEVRRAAPYSDLDWQTWERIVDLVATGGYALAAYDRFRRIVRGPDGVWRARTSRDAQRHRMNVGVIVEAPALSVRKANFVGGNASQGPEGARRTMRAGRKLGEIEEYFLSTLAPGDTFLFAGEVLRFLAIQDNDALVVSTSDPEPAIPYYAGGKFPLSTFLAGRVREMIHDPRHWPALPAPVREWFAVQRLRSAIPAPDHLLVETFPRGGRFYLVAYPFEGRLAHQTLGMLLTRRLERAGAKPLGFVASEYALAIWGLEDMAGLDMNDLFSPDMLGDDLEEWLAESVLMKRTFRQCAQVSGLIARRFPGQEKTSRQVTFSTDLIYDVLREHEPGHILLQAARQEAASGLLDIRRLSDALGRIAGRIDHQRLAKISPFAVPVMLEVGKEPVSSLDTQDAILLQGEADLIAEAMGR